MGYALSANRARAGAHRRLMRMLALGAALLGSTSHEAAAVIIPPDLIPTPAAVSADLLFNFTPPDPIHVRTFGRHDLSGPGGRLLEDSALFPSPFLFASVPSIEDRLLLRASTPCSLAGRAWDRNIPSCSARASATAGPPWFQSRAPSH